MVEEADGIADGVHEHLRIALMIATQFGQQVAKLRADLARDDAAKATEVGKLITARFEAERAGAMAALAPTYEENWWAGAGSQQIADAYETATVWADYDPRAAAALEHIHDEVQERYGVDTYAPGADEPLLRDAMLNREVVDGHARKQAELDGSELTAAQLLLAVDTERMWAQNGIQDPPEQIDIDEEWDSPDRRATFAASLQGKDIPAAAIEARLLADVDQARHPREAVSAAFAATPKAQVAGPQQGRLQELSGR